LSYNGSRNPPRRCPDNRSMGFWLTKYDPPHVPLGATPYYTGTRDLVRSALTNHPRPPHPVRRTRVPFTLALLPVSQYLFPWVFTCLFSRQINHSTNTLITPSSDYRLALILTP